MIPNSHLGITHTKAEPRLRNSSKRGSICWAVVGSMWQSRSVYRLCPPATALLHRSYSRVTFDLGFPAFYEFQWQGVRTCGKRVKHGPQGAKPVRPDCAVRCRGKAGQRWQFLRAIHDFGPLDAKRGPWRQDSRAMYPESPDCARKWMHRARILPF